MKLDTNSPIVDLDNKPIMIDEKPLTIGRLVSEILTQVPNDTWKPLKALAVSQRFHSGETIDLDDSDASDLRQIIENNKTHKPLVLGRILQILIDSKDTNSKNTK